MRSRQVEWAWNGRTGAAAIVPAVTYAIFAVTGKRLRKVPGDLERAIADFNEAIRLDPKNAQAFNQRYQAQEGRPHTRHPQHRCREGDPGRHCRPVLARRDYGNRNRSRRCAAPLSNAICLNRDDR
jgi:hypothetical protein